MTAQQRGSSPDPQLGVDLSVPWQAASGSESGEERYGWPINPLKPITQNDVHGRARRVRAPVMDQEGLLTPTELHYVVQHFDVPEPVSPKDWSLTIDGEVKRPLKLDFPKLRQLFGRTVRMVMECSGSDAGFFEYMKNERERPSRSNEMMQVSSSEWTGVPMAAVLNEAGLTNEAAFIRMEGWDLGVPDNAPSDKEPFFYDKGLPISKALHPDTILAWAQNGQPLDHIHGAPVRVIVPGWSGNWSVKWVRRFEVMDHMPDCWYHYNFYYFGESPEDPNKELITNLGVRSITTYPKDNVPDPSLPQGVHVIRGLAWSGDGTIVQVEVSVDGGKTWQDARLEEPRDRWMWVRWSFPWKVSDPGVYTIMSRATDESGRVEAREPRYNYMRKNFGAIVPLEVIIR